MSSSASQSPDAAGCNDVEQAVAERYYSELKIPDRRQVSAFKEYQKMVHFALHMPRLDNILEIGAGLSTVLFAQLCGWRKCTVYSIDKSFCDILGKIRFTSFYEPVNERIRSYREASISKRDFDSFYGNWPKQDLGGVDFKSLKKNMDEFVRFDLDSRKWDRFLDGLPVNEKRFRRPEDVFFTRDGLVLPEEIINLYRESNDEVDYFSKNHGDKGVIHSLIEEVSEFDLVFFDSGVFSSYVEWLLLKDHIRKGGAAVFHDIYFPKSIKNFLICASLRSDPEWEIVYKDALTPQGLLIAGKKEYIQ